MKNIFQTVVSFEVIANAPVELTAGQLCLVSGGLGPNDSWATTTIPGPNDSWATTTIPGPNDSW